MKEEEEKTVETIGRARGEGGRRRKKKKRKQAALFTLRCRLPSSSSSTHRTTTLPALTHHGFIYTTCNNGIYVLHVNKQGDGQTERQLVTADVVFELIVWIKYDVSAIKEREERKRGGDEAVERKPKHVSMCSSCLWNMRVLSPPCDVYQGLINRAEREPGSSGLLDAFARRFLPAVTYFAAAVLAGRRKKKK